MSARRIPPVLEWALFLAGILMAGLVIYAAYGRFYRAAYPTGYRDLVAAESARNNLPPSLVFAVIRTESGFDPSAQSSVQARGLMQITKDTFEWAQYRVGEDRILHFDDLFESDLNVRYGAAILRLLLDEFGTEANALCAYHAGWGKAKEWLSDPACAPDGENITNIPYGDTRRYVAKVLQTKQVYETLYRDLSDTQTP